MDNKKIEEQLNTDAQEKALGRKAIYEYRMLEKALKHYKVEEVPEDSHKRFTMSNWGKRKRENYHNLVTEGLTKDEAYDRVEFGGQNATASTEEKRD